MKKLGLILALAASLSVAPVYADRDEGALEDRYGTVCFDDVVDDNGPSASECGRVNGEAFVNTSADQGDD